MKRLWLRGAGCLNAELSGALPTGKMQRFKLYTFVPNTVRKES